MRAFTKAAGIQVVGDDFSVTSEEKVKTANGACNAVLLKPNQVGTVTETLACREAARAAGYGAIVSARSGETEDVSIVAPRGRLGRAAAQGRQLLALRAHGEVERGPAHRGVPGRQGAPLSRAQALQETLSLPHCRLPASPATIGLSLLHRVA